MKRLALILGVSLAVVVAVAVALTGTAGAAGFLLETPAASVAIPAGQAVSFTWLASPYTTQNGRDGSPLAYQIRFQVAADSSFSSPMIDVSFSCTSADTCPSSATQLLQPGTYYWRLTSSYDACLSALGASGTFESGAANLCQPQTSDVRSFTVTAAAATTTTTATPVHSAPKLKVLATTIRAETTGQLSFRTSSTWSNLGVVLGVFSGKRKVYTKTFKNLAAQVGVTYSASWRPTKRGTYNFCAEAEDAAGTKTVLSCAKVTVT